MKKTLTVNLGGTVYHIDEDAYRLLDNYLSNLKHYFRKQESVEEIVDDIEMRIAELFAEKIVAIKQVITIQDVEEVIARVGKPEDFGVQDDEEESPRASEQEKNSTQDADNRSADVRRLFRDPDDKQLGGVAAGIAAYFDWDVTLVRVLMIVLVFVPYFPAIILYLIAWAVIPEAHTATEKLNMRGEPVTIENIGKTVTDGFERVAAGVNSYMNSDKPRTLLQKLGDWVVSIAAILAKVFLVALAVLCCPVLFVLAVLLVAMVVVAVATTISGGALLYELLPFMEWTSLAAVSPLMVLLSGISVIAFFAIPLGVFLYGILRQLFRWSPMSTGAKWTLLIVWITGAAILAVTLPAIGWQLPVWAIF